MANDFDLSLFEKEILQSKTNINVNNIKKSTISYLSEIFSIENCYVIKYNENKPPKVVEIEHISSDNNQVIPKSETLKAVDLNTEYDFNYWTELFITLHKNEDKSDLYIRNIDEYIRTHNLKSTKIEKFFHDINFESGLWLGILENNTPEYLLIFSFKEIIPGCELDEKFIKLLTKNIKLNIVSDRMISKIKAFGEIYKLFNNLSKMFKKTLDVNVIKNEIINEVVKIFNADRCFFRVYDFNRKILFSPDNEYLKSKDVESITYYVYPREANEYSLLNYTEKGVFIIENVELFIKENEDSKFPHIKKTIQVFKEQNLKSFYGFALYDEKNIFNIFELQYTKEKVVLDQENINLLKKIITQSSFALKEAEFFEFQKYTAKKEKTLRGITEQAMLFTKEKDYFDYLFKEIYEIFNIDAVIFIRAPRNENEKPQIIHEFIKEKGHLSMLGGELPIECIKTYSYMIKTFFPVVVNNTNNFYADEYGRQCFYKQFGVEAFLTTPVITETHPQIAIGAIILISHSPRIWLKNEIDLMRAIDDITMRTIDRIKKFNEIEDLRNSFIQTMSHDMQVPMVADKKALEILLKKSDDSQIRSIKPILEELKISIDNQQETLKKYIQIYQYESGLRQLDLQATDIKSLIISEVSKLETLLELKRINMEVYTPDNLANINFDESEICKVISIFLNNAIEYTPINSKIEIKVNEYKDIITVCVSDNGPGIPNNIRENIFNRFKMIERLQRKIGGGLSLYLCKLIVESHGGKIWYNSNNGNGSIFCFSLPKATLELQE